MMINEKGGQQYQHVVSYAQGRAVGVVAGATRAFN